MSRAPARRKQFDPEFTSDYPDVPSELVDGAVVSGVILYPGMDPNSPLKLIMEGSSENSDLGKYGAFKWKFTWS